MLLYLFVPLFLFFFLQNNFFFLFYYYYNYYYYQFLHFPHIYSHCLYHLHLLHTLLHIHILLLHNLNHFHHHHHLQLHLYFHLFFLFFFFLLIYFFLYKKRYCLLLFYSWHSICPDIVEHNSLLDGRNDPGTYPFGPISFLDAILIRPRCLLVTLIL